MASGYDNFFKEAQKAKGLTSGKPKVAAKKTAAPTEARETARNWKLKSGKTESPEDRLRAELADRMSRKRKLAKGRRAKFPLGPAVFACVALVIATVGFVRPELLETAWDQTLGKLEVGVFGEASAAEEKKKPETKPDPKSEEKAKAPEKSAEGHGKQEEKPAETAAATSGSVPGAKVPNINKWTPEELSFFSKLSDRKRELDQRESELNKLEEELHKRKAELDEKLKSLEATRADISKALKVRVANDQEKVEKLVQFYSNMKPQQAAKVIESINEDLAVEVIDKMKKKNAAEIMNMMDAKKARRISELLTGYQRSPASGPSNVSGAKEEAGATEETTKE